MRLNRKKKNIVFTPHDGKEWTITLVHPDFDEDGNDEVINVKVHFSEKGMGLQFFSEKLKQEERKPLQVFIEGGGYAEAQYAGVWKLLPEVRQQIRKKYKGKR